MTRKLFQFSDASLQIERANGNEYNFITFLAVIQKLQVGILPITWQAALAPIGAGATSTVKEAAFDIETSLAFKCVSDKQKQNADEAAIIGAVISEIIFLCHPYIRNHPYITELQGICWDIPSDNQVWPALVLEKSQYGDLYNFIISGVGRELSVTSRLKLCVDVGIAISDLHFCSKLP